MDMLELKNVYQSYHKHKPILRDITLTIKQGQFVSVIGPSGAGKTTLLRLFNHMACPVSGEVWVGGLRFDTLNGQKRRQVQHRVGMVFQDFCLVEESTCLQNVLNGCLADMPIWRVLSGHFPARVQEQARAALQQVGLAEQEHGYHHNRLSEMKEHTLDDEIEKSQEELQQQLGITNEFFCYPYGGNNPAAEAALKKAGIKLAFTMNLHIVLVVITTTQKKKGIFGWPVWELPYFYSRLYPE